MQEIVPSKPSTPNAVMPLNSDLQRAVKRTLHYFDFFDHALSVSEIQRFLELRVDEVQLNDALGALVAHSEVVAEQGWYGLKKSSVENRIKYLALNQRKLRIARRVGWFIRFFPFVRGVYLSGSLSKMGVQSEMDDLDFFILTAPGRVWTAKLVLIAFKKVFLLDSEKYFCINLLMDEDKLEIAKQNRYTATEVISLITLSNPSGRSRFLAENAWVRTYFPNVVLPELQAQRPARTRLVERVINVCFGKGLERWAKKKFTAHMQSHTDQRDGYFEAESHSSAYFPQSVEQRLLAHLDTFENDQ